MEIYKDIEGYEGLYQVSNLGNVKSLERKIEDNNGYYTLKERILKPAKSGGGYMQVVLSKQGKVKTLRVHRLVAEAFIDNPNNYPIINHKDEDKTNNNVINLEWCDKSYNALYGSCSQKKREKLKGKKKIYYKIDNKTYWRYAGIEDV